MSYPRNNATPPIIDLGEIVLKSDGTQQTTGASARVKIGTGAWGAAAGTLACDSTSGIWTYAPTQAETNADYFIVGAYKASCTSISKTVVTSNSATAGQVRLEGVTHTSAVIPTVTTTTTATNVTTVNGLAANVITASSIATDAVQEIADAVLTRSASHVEGSAGEHTLCTLILANLEWEIVGTAWKIFRTNGTTLHYEKTATGSSTNDPIHKVE